MVISALDLFKIGIGPSSSHTVGPMLAAAQFSAYLKDAGLLTSVTRVVAEMFGSLGATGKGHGTPKAVLLGLEGEEPESVDVAGIAARVAYIRDNHRLNLGVCHSISYNHSTDFFLHRRKSLPFHPNGMIFSAFDELGTTLIQKTFYSVGGGFVVDGNAHSDDCLIEDSRQLPYEFDSGAELLALCARHNMSIAELMLANEEAWRPTDVTRAQLLKLWCFMKECIDNGIANSGILPGGLQVPRRANKLHLQLIARPDSTDPLAVLDWVTLYALAVNEENAAGGRVVTAPTNGAAGIIPAVLNYYLEFVPGANSEGIVTFLLTAAAIGTLYKKNASISGAEVGCQGEIGSACSMAAGALTAVLGGTPEQVENAAEIGM